jgi:hypothetical protein
MTFKVVALVALIGAIAELAWNVLTLTASVRYSRHVALAVASIYYGGLIAFLFQQYLRDTSDSSPS